LPGIAWITAHGHNGNFTAAAIPEGHTPDPAVFDYVDAKVKAAFDQAVAAGTLSWADADAQHTDATNRVLSYGGKIDYLSSIEPTPEVAAITSKLARELYGDQPAANDRLTATVGPAEGLARVVASARATAGQNALGGKGDPGTQGEHSGPPGNESVAAPGVTGAGAGAPASDLNTPPAGGQKDGAPAAPTPDAPDPLAIGDTKADPVAIDPDVAKNALDYLDGKTSFLHQ